MSDDRMPGDWRRRSTSGVNHQLSFQGVIMLLAEVQRFRKFMLAAVVGSVGVAGVAPAMAAPVVFTDEAAFNAAVAGAGIVTRQDGFEGLSTGYRGPLDREGFTVSGTSPNPNFSVYIDNQWATDGKNTLLAPNTPVTFAFDQAVRAFSIDLIDNFVFAPASYSLSLNGGQAQTLFDMPNYVDPRPRVIQFLGILDLDGIDSLALSSFYHINPDVDAGLIRMDRMRYEDTTATPVPEPSTMLLLGAGLAGVARFRKRRA
jgi:hypothetical protein